MNIDADAKPGDSIDFEAMSHQLDSGSSDDDSTVRNVRQLTDARTEYHWVKESYELGDISPQRIETTWNLSDCMTKALPRETIERLVPGLSGYGEVPKAPGPAPT